MISVIGGGNMGSVLAVKFSQKCDVALYVGSGIEVYEKDMILFNEDQNRCVNGKISIITDDLSVAIKDSEYIFITYPPFLFEKLANDMIPLLSDGQHLVFVPGSGSAELFFKDALKKGCTITGLQRVHSVARIVEKGKKVRESGVRNSISIASIPKSFNKEACIKLEELYSIGVRDIDNYLNITLINSNSILHTARLYCIFKDYSDSNLYDSLPLFYEGWNDESSEMLALMDKELFLMFDVLKQNGIVVDRILPLLIHYESNSSFEMTNKIKSINSLKGLKTPSVISAEGKYLPDFSSRYFIADFPYGLDILIAFSRVLNTSVDNMEKVSRWYHSVTNTDSKFDLTLFGINNIQDLKNFYCL